MSADVFCHGNATVHSGLIFQVTLNSRADSGGISGLHGREGLSAGAEHSWDTGPCSVCVVVAAYC